MGFGSIVKKVSKSVSSAAKSVGSAASSLTGGDFLGTAGSLLGLGGAYIQGQQNAALAAQNREDQKEQFQKQFTEGVRQFNRNLLAQKEFAKNSLRWGVQDAKNAGLHPLAATAAGYNPSTSSPIQLTNSGGSGETGISSALQNASQSLRDAKARRISPEEKALNAAALAKVQAETGTEITKGQMYASEAALNRQSYLNGIGTSVPLATNEIENHFNKAVPEQTTYKLGDIPAHKLPKSGKITITRPNGRKYKIDVGTTTDSIQQFAGEPGELIHGLDIIQHNARKYVNHRTKSANKETQTARQNDQVFNIH